MRNKSNRRILKNEKKVLAFSQQMMYDKQVARTWLVGQAVKTPPSHGGNRGSIPLRTAETRKSEMISGFFVVIDRIK